MIIDSNNWLSWELYCSQPLEGLRDMLASLFNPCYNILTDTICVDGILENTNYCKLFWIAPILLTINAKYSSHKSNYLGESIYGTDS